jgi:2-polyprenyl-6-methoxyphenol hydroxylase-like FAD-dependent oxidoreductase
MTGDPVVVAGGSLAGLLAALVLAEEGLPVTVVERDRFTRDAQFRAGVPQGRHAHALSEGGRLALEELLPGISAELRELGAVSVAVPGDIDWLTLAGWIPAYPTRYTWLSCTRPLLEWAVRRRVLTHPGITLLQGTELTGLEIADGAVRGLVLRADAVRRRMPTRLFVDATGRGSKTPAWLSEAGVPAPEEQWVDPGVSYATGLFRHPAAAGGGRRRAIDIHGSLENPRHGVAYPAENDRWVVSVGGMRGYPAPRNLEEMRDFAGRLRSPLLCDLLAEAVPDSPVFGFRPPPSRRRRFERTARRLDGLVVTGDALCTLNPIYAQGMTVAIRGAVELRETMRRYGTAPGFTRRAQQAIARECDVPWKMAASEDLSYPATEGGRRSLLLRFQHAYFAQVEAAAIRDPHAFEVYADLLALTAGPSRLYRPRALGAVLAAVPGGDRHSATARSTPDQRMP